MSNVMKYYADDDLSAWERVKKAFANDWEQTKADFGSDEARDMDQDVDDTIRQAIGTDDAFENREQAFRFGYAAKRRYKTEHPDWSDDLERHLRKDYDGDYAKDSAYIRHAYEYRYPY